jgi:hypothetical protein
MARTRGFFVHDETPKIATVIWKMITMINHREFGVQIETCRTVISRFCSGGQKDLGTKLIYIDLSFRVFLARIKLISDRAVKILSIKLCYALLCFATKACGLFTTGSLLTQTTSS